MRSIRSFGVPLIVIAVAVVVLWPFVDRQASRVSMCVAGFGLVLAWYSILDLREQRNERIWPHTIDRLLRATFTAVTVVCVVDLVFTPDGAPPVAPPTQDTSPPVQQATFAEDVRKRAEDGPWTTEELQSVVAKHFRGLRARKGEIIVETPNDRRFLIAGRDRAFIVEVP